MFFFNFPALFFFLLMLFSSVTYGHIHFSTALICQQLPWMTCIWSILGKTQTLSGPFSSFDKRALHKRRSFYCELRRRRQKVRRSQTFHAFLSPQVAQRLKKAAVHQPSSLIHSVVSSCGGASTHLIRGLCWHQIKTRMQGDFSRGGRAAWQPESKCSSDLLPQN